MSYVAISFPVSAGTPKQRKDESLRKATKFSKELGLKPGVDVELTQIREGTYGLVMPSDLDDEVLIKAKRLGGKVSQFVESQEPTVNINEATWIKLGTAAPGMRFKMNGTQASDPQEGKILPGSYFVLGIDESNGGKFVTLGKVDKLVEIGREGKGRYVYNVDIDLLSKSLETPAVKTESKKINESTSVESDRTDEILDMLLENDPYVKASKKKAEAKAAKTESEDEPSLEDMVAASMDEVVAPSSDLVESAESVETSEEKTDETPADNSETSEEDSVEDSEKEADEDTKQESEDEDVDPELYLEGRAIVEALTEAGYDVDKMSEDELHEAIMKLPEDEDEATEKSDSKDAEASAPVDEEPEASEKSESDDSFEATETK